MPLDAYGLDLAIKGVLSGGSTQIRIHSDDPGAADANDNVIVYTGLTATGGPEVAANGWTYNDDGTAKPTSMVDFPVPPDGFSAVNATWISAWRGSNRIGKFRVRVRNTSQTDPTQSDYYVDGSVEIAAQRIPRLNPDNFIWTVPAS